MMFYKAPVILQKLVFPRAWLAVGVFGLFAISWGFSVSSANAAGATYYVDNTSANCNNSNPGTSAAAPWCTIAKANSAHSGGDIVKIKGEYRERLVPKSGPSVSQPTIFTGYTTDKTQTVILGSDQLTNWTRVGSSHVYWAPFAANQQFRSGGIVRNTNCWLNRTTWFRRGALTASGDTLSDLNAAGEFFYDQSAQRVYVWMPDSTTPADDQIECSKRPVLKMGEISEGAPYIIDDPATPTSVLYNFTLKDLTIMQTLDRGISFRDAGQYTHDVTIQNIDISFTTGGSYYANNPAAIIHTTDGYCDGCVTNFNIINSTIHDVGSDHGGPWDDPNIDGYTHRGAAIELYGIGNSTIQGNTIYRSPESIWLKYGNVNIDVKDNILYDVQDGIALGYMSSSSSNFYMATVEGNLVYNVKTRGISSRMGNAHSHIYNNTVVNALEGISIDSDRTDDRHGNVHATLRNNLVYDVRPDSQGLQASSNNFLAFYYNSLQNSSSNNNLFHDPGSIQSIALTSCDGSQSGCSSLYANLTAWQVALHDQQSLYVNPLFVNASARNYTLQSTSPAIDKGVFISGFHCAQSYDVNPTQTGCRHWKGTAPDIGAFEYGIATTTTPSSTPSSTTQSVSTTPDPNGTFVVAVDGGASSAVRVITGGRFQREFFAFEKSFRGGLSLAFGDVWGDAQKEVVVGSGIGRLGEVRLFNTAGARVASFYPYGTAFRNGVNVALADVNGDGTKEIITVPMQGDQRVRTFGFRNGRYTQVQAQFNSGFLSTSMAAGDLNADGRDDIAVMSEAAGSPTLMAYTLRGTRYQRIASLRGAFSTRFRTGYSLAIADVNQDGNQEIVATRSSITEPEVRTFTIRGSSFRQQSVFTALGKTAKGGGRISVMDYNGDGTADILLTRNIAADPKVYIYSMLGGVRRIGTVQAFPANRRFVLVPAGK